MNAMRRYENRLVTFAMTSRNQYIFLTTSNSPEHSRCNATTLKMKPKLKNMMTIGSTLKPGLSSVYNLNMVPELPPAPADLVLDGRAFFTDSL